MQDNHDHATCHQINASKKSTFGEYLGCGIAFRSIGAQSIKEDIADFDGTCWVKIEDPMCCHVKLHFEEEINILIVSDG